MDDWTPLDIALREYTNKPTTISLEERLAQYDLAPDTAPARLVELGDGQTLAMLFSQLEARDQVRLDVGTPEYRWAGSLMLGVIKRDIVKEAQLAVAIRSVPEASERTKAHVAWMDFVGRMLEETLERTD